jgi:competence protein ComEC
VAHHGSKSSTSEAWLRFWRPEHAAISVGANNVYGHPSPVVMDRLIENGTDVYRTDLSGELRVTVAPSGKMTFATKMHPIGSK